MGLSLMVNGRERALEQLGENCSLSDVIAGLDLKPDRVAVELNGAICPRTQWGHTPVRTGDRLEIVHFVGGGAPSRTEPTPSASPWKNSRSAENEPTGSEDLPVSIELLDRKPPPADFRLAYGTGEFNFGDLRLPAQQGTALAPLVVLIHGGWWKAAYGLEYGGHLCADLKAHGVATWSLEYRRVGNAGGGWPGTFEDVAAGFDYVATLASTHPLDMSRIVVAGHSAGGHLAFWLAGRPHTPEDSVVHNPQPHLAICAAVSLAGAVDLRMTIELAGNSTFAHDRDEVLTFMGAAPERAPERYAAGDPGELLPLNVPQYLVQGTEDDQIPPELPHRWVERGRSRGETASLQMIPGADHFDVVDPESKAWPLIRSTILKSLA